MTPAKKPTAAAKAAAAKDETADNPAPKRTEYRGLQLDLPDVLPSTILFDLTELEASTDPMPVFRLLRSVLGPEQFAQVRLVVKDDEDVAELAEELLDAIFGQYGISLGE